MTISYSRATKKKIEMNPETEVIGGVPGKILPPGNTGAMVASHVSHCSWQCEMVGAQQLPHGMGVHSQTGLHCWGASKVLPSQPRTHPWVPPLSPGKDKDHWSQVSRHPWPNRRKGMCGGGGREAYRGGGHSEDLTIAIRLALSGWSQC